MARLNPLMVLNILAICVITGCFLWAIRLPEPGAGAVEAAPNPSEGLRSVAAGVTVARPVHTGQPGAAELPRAEGDTAGAEEPARGIRLQPLSASTETAARSTESVVDPGWLADTATRTRIPSRALQAYAASASTANAKNPACGIGWNTLAAIGHIESGHGTHGAGSLTDSGIATQPIIGPPLDGEGFASIPDTDDGALDGDTTWDRAVGPMQFIPSTWEWAGRDGNGDGRADAMNIDDAALSAALYLCAHGRSLTTDGGWTDAVLSYNHSSSYVSQVRDQANAYASLAGAAG